MRSSFASRRRKKASSADQEEAARDGTGVKWFISKTIHRGNASTFGVSIGRKQREQAIIKSFESKTTFPCVWEVKRRFPSSTARKPVHPCNWTRFRHRLNVGTDLWNPMTFKPLNYGPRTHPPTTVRGNQLNLTQTRLTNWKRPALTGLNQLVGFCDDNDAACSAEDSWPLRTGEVS